MNGLKKVLDFLATLLSPIAKAVTVGILDELKSFLVNLRTKAEKTPNPWDDILVDVLCTLFGVK